jgi:pyruvate/2-oxoglutarate dehydrogenase complex dihydrolipoamide acyltransferase (E2) component
MEIKVPDIGDFDSVPVIEILVAAGDTVAVEDPLVVLESDKATMEVPSPAAGKVTDITVAVGDKVAEGSVLLTLETSDEPAAPRSPSRRRSRHSPRPTPTCRSRSPSSAAVPAATRPRSGPRIWGSRWR